MNEARKSQPYRVDIHSQSCLFYHSKKRKPAHMCGLNIVSSSQVVERLLHRQIPRKAALRLLFVHQNFVENSDMVDEKDKKAQRGFPGIWL